MVDLHIRRLDKDLALFDKEAARLAGAGDSPDRAAALAAAMTAAAAGGKPAKSHAKRSGKAGASPGAALRYEPQFLCSHAASAFFRQAAGAGRYHPARWPPRAVRWAC